MHEIVRKTCGFMQLCSLKNCYSCSAWNCGIFFMFKGSKVPTFLIQFLDEFIIPLVKAFFVHNLFDFVVISSSFSYWKFHPHFWIHDSFLFLCLSITYSFYTPTQPWHNSQTVSHKQFFSNDSQALLMAVCLQVISLSSSKSLTFMQVSFCAEWNPNAFVCGDIEIVSPWAVL